MLKALVPTLILVTQFLIGLQGVEAPTWMLDHAPDKSMPKKIVIKIIKDIEWQQWSGQCTDAEFMNFTNKSFHQSLKTQLINVRINSIAPLSENLDHRLTLLGIHATTILKYRPREFISIVSVGLNYLETDDVQIGLGLLQNKYSWPITEEVKRALVGGGGK